jgi:hypothetical protein
MDPEPPLCWFSPKTLAPAFTQQQHKAIPHRENGLVFVCLVPNK